MAKITIHVYNTVETWDDATSALAKYTEAMLMCEGSEKDRYANIVGGLISGETDIYDE